MANLGRLLLIAGVILVILGAGLILGSKLGLEFGRLPGDIDIEWSGGKLYVPLGTSLLLSIALTILLNVLVGIFRK